MEAQGLKPKQGDLGGGGADGLPQAPAIGRSGQDENEEQKEGVVLAAGKDRNQGRPNDIGAMHQQAEGRCRLLPPPQEDDDHYALGQIEGQQGEGPKGIADLPRIHPDGDQRGDCQEDPGAGQPAFNAANFARAP